jgi:predicted DCC family thiol-disulfide oxidoreductase YuxK
VQEEYIMNTISKTLKASSGAAALIAAGIPPLAQGQEARETLHITGNVVCAQCSLEEIRPTQSDQGQLYQFIHAQGAVVGRIRSVNDSPTWRYLGWPSEIPVRVRDEVFRKLMAEENLFKDVEID